MPITDLDTLLLPVVEVGNLGKEHIKDMYYTKKDDTRLALYPVLSLRKSFNEMYAGDSEYARRIFYLASSLPRDLVAQHTSFVLKLKDTSEYIKREPKKQLLK